VPYAEVMNKYRGMHDKSVHGKHGRKIKGWVLDRINADNSG
jgi:hypothetical protein